MQTGPPGRPVEQQAEGCHHAQCRPQYKHVEREPTLSSTGLSNLKQSEK